MLLSALLTALMFCIPARAQEAEIPWWVDDAAVGANVGDALEALWPENPVVVRSGDPPQEWQGILYEDAVLTLRLEGRVWEQEVGPEVETQVILARSWVRTLALSDTGWAPARIVQAVEEGPRPIVVAANERRLQVWSVAGAGGALRLGETPAARLSLQGGLSFNRWVGITIVATLDAGGSQTLPYGSQAVSLTRGGAYLGVVGHIRFGQSGMFTTLGVGDRFGDARMGNAVLPTVWTNTWTVRLQAYGPSSIRALRPLVGIAFEADAIGIMRFHGYDLSGGAAMVVELGLSFGKPFGVARKTLKDARLGATNEDVQRLSSLDPYVN